MFELFDATDFRPRWHCGNWSLWHGWTHIVADLAIFAAYTAIPIALVYFIRRRRDTPFLPIFWLFVAFIFACGFGHLVEATLFWQPWYRLSALMKVITAVVSWATVIALLPILPKALALPGLALANARLAAEVAERQRAELQLRQSADQLEHANQDLQRLAQSMVGREERLVELKQEVNALLGELGREPRYLVDQAKLVPTDRE